jgi:dipeptidyl aminopeptidase/acylaminoacyl peptidase
MKSIFKTRQIIIQSILLFFILFQLNRSCFSQTNSISPLSLKEIMKGNEFIGHQPSNPRWSMDGSQLIFEWNPNNEPGESTYFYDLKTKKYRKGSSADFFNYPEAIPNPYNFDVLYYEASDALFKYDFKAQKNTLVSYSNSKIQHVYQTPNQNIIYYLSDNNLFQLDTKTGVNLQITNFIKGEKSSEKKNDSHLEKQQKELFQFIRDQEIEKQFYENQSQLDLKLPNPIYTGKENLENIQISPDGAFVCFRLSSYQTTKATHVEHHITTDGHSQIRNAREKVNDSDDSHRFGIYNRALDSSYFLDFSKLSFIRKKPIYFQNYGDTNLHFDADRKIVMHKVVFSEKGHQAVMDIRSYDNKDRWIISIDFESGNFTEIEHQHDEAWIGGPGISSWNAYPGTLGWFKDGNRIYFQSEETGYSHLYSYNFITKKKNQLTEGKFEIHEVQLSKDGKTAFITANKTHPGNRDFYHFNIETKTWTTLLTSQGFHEVVVSPDESQLLIRYSFKNKPWELYVCANRPRAVMEQITFSTSETFKSYTWREAEVITFKASDGIDVYARLYQPEAKTKNKAAIIFVHGAGYLQNAHNSWSGYYREYMFHNYLVDNGFTVLDIDYRASAGYGRDYRTAIYQHMGGRDLQDHVDGKKYLVDSLGINPDKVGIYGGSYGGFITLMALLTTPDEFACGAAIRSVTDWAHYNHEYTNNILNYPNSDPNAYKISSPIYFAENLKRKLLILHGMVDDNVQFQDVVRLSQRFIELGIDNWELAVYPVEAHGFTESYSWNDEYRRIYELFYNELILK